jgi:hypothetical protein
MRRSTTSLLAVALTTCFAASAAAQDGLVTTPKGEGDDTAEAIIDDRVAPPEQEEALKVFAATWKCTGTSATDYGVDVPTTVTVTGKKDLGGRWLVVKTELVAKAKGAKPILSQEIWGVSRTGGLVRNGATSDGGFITSTSTGWTGERFAWTGTSAQNGKEAREKFSVEKKGDKELALEMSLGVGELRVLFEGTCKR